jgi:glutamate-1-semialdehyde 2,1-aminomutase
LDRGRVAALLAAEWERFAATTAGSAAHHARASVPLPLGVASSFQHWEPHPIAITSARGAWLRDVDGRAVLDLSMGFGAMLVGHLNPVVVAAVTRALDTGTMFVTPAPSTTEVAERFQRRFGLGKLRFANSGTEATMYAVKVARAFTRRRGIVKIEGGYHGGYDALSVSVKPDLGEAGPDSAPVPVTPFEVEPGPVQVVPYNDLPRLEQVLAEHGADVAAVVMEPVLENLSIVVPDAGYLAGVRAACDRHEVLLVFDEVKTGLTAGYAGAAQRLGVTPDLIALAKSIGGGLPLAAFGGRADVLAVISDGRMWHFGTYNGNPLVMAAAAAVDEVCTVAALAEAESVNERALRALDEVKTGLTAGYAGAAQRLGVRADLIALAKSIGGGLPLAAFGGRADIMAVISDGRMWHFGTYNGNPLVMAAAAAVDEVCTVEALAAAESVNKRALQALDDVIAEWELPAHTVAFGVKGAVTWSDTPVRNYRDYRRTDFAAAELTWLWGLNRAILTPPGLDEQWLVSLSHTRADMDLLVGAFTELAQALRA